jgi:hypothetical protein
MLLAVGTVFAAAPGEAQATPQLRLVYVREAGTESCPHEMELRMAVTSRLGYDPFSATASAAIVARLSVLDQALAGSVELVDENGISRGRRELSSNAEHCDELARALALSISIAVDPEAKTLEQEPVRKPGLRANEPVLGVAIERPVEEDHESPADEGSEDEQERGTELALRVTGLSMLWMAPAPAFGGAASASLRLGAASMEAGFRRVDAAAAEVDDGMKLGASAWAGELGVCLHEGVAAYCGVGLLGQLTLDPSGVAQPKSPSALLAAAGGRLRIALPLAEAVALNGQLELLASLRRNHAEVDGREIWRVPPVHGGAGLGVELSFQ